MTANEGREQFIERYTEGRGSTELNSRGRYAIPCECGENGCSGWQMAHPRSVENFLASLPVVPAATKELIEELAAWEMAQRVDHSGHITELGDACGEGTTWKTREGRDVAIILKKFFALEALTGEQETKA